MWHPRRFNEQNESTTDIEDPWEQYTNSKHESFIAPEDYTRDHIFSPEYRLCNRQAAAVHDDDDDGNEELGKTDDQVGFEVLTSTYDQELLCDLERCGAKYVKAAEGAPGMWESVHTRLSDADVEQIFLAHVFRRHSEAIREEIGKDHGDKMTTPEMRRCLERQYELMMAAHARGEDDDGDDDTTTETDLDSTHGRVVDRRSRMDRRRAETFSLFQTTIRLQRREGHFFLNASLSDRPPRAAPVPGMPNLGRYRIQHKKSLPFQLTKDVSDETCDTFNEVTYPRPVTADYLNHPHLHGWICRARLLR